MTKKAPLPRGIGDLMLLVVSHLENYKLDADHTAKILDENFGARMRIGKKRVHVTVPLDVFMKVPEVKLVAAILLLLTSKPLLHLLTQMPDLETEEDRQESAKALSYLLGGGDFNVN